MTKYTVVGLMPEEQRIAAWVEAESPEQAEEFARNGPLIAFTEEGTGYGDELEVAGIFEGHLMAVDEY